MTLDDLTNFFGWWTLINLVLYLITVVSVILYKDKISVFQARLLGVSPDDLKPLYIQYIARFKLIILTFNLAPYLALRLFVS